jgi:bacterial/archaeal transporter family-2 protein
MAPTTAATIAAVVAGLAGALQATVLGLLGRRIGVLAAATVNALIAAILLAVLALAFGRGAEGIPSAIKHPVWLWVIPGVMGATVVTALAYAPPLIGTFGTFALVIAGQLAAALLIDSVGLFGVDRVPLSVTRVAGLVLLAGGAALALRR